MLPGSCGSRQTKWSALNCSIYEHTSVRSTSACSLQQILAGASLGRGSHLALGLRWLKGLGQFERSHLSTALTHSRSRSLPPPTRPLTPSPSGKGSCSPAQEGPLAALWSPAALVFSRSAAAGFHRVFCVSFPFSSLPLHGFQYPSLINSSLIYYNWTQSALWLTGGEQR